MALYLPIQALNRSQAVRIGSGATGVMVKSTGITYVDISVGGNKRDLAHHASIGAFIVVGALTVANVDPIVTNGGVVSAGGASNVNVTAGDLKNRSTAVVTPIPASTNSPAVTNNASGNPRIDLAVADNTTGVVTVVAGTPAVSPVAPAIPAGKTGLYTFTVVTGGGVPSLFVDVRPRP